MKRVIYAALLLLLSGVYERGNCQSSRQKFKMEDFSAAGTAYRSGGNCFVLTEDDFWQGGSIWYKQPISLDAPFNMEMKINFGDRDEFGADGIVFVFYPRPDVDGRAGEGMGFGGLRPSLGIEIDTYQNYHLDDPEEDHIAFMVNGITHHAHSIAGPVRVNPTGNIEDGRIHLVKIDWDPAIHYLRIYIDHQLRLSMQQNLKENIFYGNPTVYWGFTAATGKRTNRQAVCIDKIEFLPPPPVLPALSRETLSSISAGKLVSLDLIEFAPGKSDINPAIGKQLDQLAGLCTAALAPY